MLSKNGAAALGRAETVRDEAALRGNIARADLFAAVCSVITWRDRVVIRWATPNGDE